MISLGLRPYLLTSKSCERNAISSFLSAETPIPISSIVPTTIAAPYFFIRGTIASKRSSPSSRLIELIIAFPCE